VVSFSPSLSSAPPPLCPVPVPPPFESLSIGQARRYFPRIGSFLCSSDLSPFPSQVSSPSFQTNLSILCRVVWRPPRGLDTLWPSCFLASKSVFPWFPPSCPRASLVLRTEARHKRQVIIAVFLTVVPPTLGPPPFVFVDLAKRFSEAFK